jgi:hypothetical protein
MHNFGTVKAYNGIPGYSATRYCKLTGKHITQFFSVAKSLEQCNWNLKAWNKLVDAAYDSARQFANYEV